MPDILDRPTIDRVTSPANTKPLPMWVVILLFDQQQDLAVIKAALLKHVPELGAIKVEKILQELKTNQAAVILKKPREIAEHYYELLKEVPLLVRCEPEY